MGWFESIALLSRTAGMKREREQKDITNDTKPKLCVDNIVFKTFRKSQATPEASNKKESAKKE